MYKPKEECSIQFPNTEKWVDKFSLTNFEVFEYWMKHSFQCLTLLLTPLALWMPRTYMYIYILKYESSDTKDIYLRPQRNTCLFWLLTIFVQGFLEESGKEQKVQWQENLYFGHKISPKACWYYFVTKSNRASWSPWIKLCWSRKL